MASTAWKKKTYGQVRPVKKAKVPQPKKPSVLELKAIFRTIDTASNGLHIDAMGQALYWWDKALPYIRLKRPNDSMSMSRVLLQAIQYKFKGQCSSSNSEKETMFAQALQTYRKYAATVISTPPITPHLQAMKMFNIKLKGTTKNLGTRYDKLTTLLSQCFSSAPFTFKVVPYCHSIASKEPIEMKLDHALSMMFISKLLAQAYTNAIRKEGLLPVAIECAYHVARAMSFEGVHEGAYVARELNVLLTYRNLMKDVVEFAASHPNAPNRLVRRTLVKPKKKSKMQKAVEAIEAGEDVHSAVGHAMTGWPKKKAITKKKIAEELTNIVKDIDKTLTKMDKALGAKKRPKSIADFHKED